MSGYIGTRDFYPEEMEFRNRMFSVLRSVCESYGYQEYNAPLLEPVSLYLQKSSEEIVSEQMYRFVDRGEREVAIRPEMTPTLARMVAAKAMQLPKPIRWYSIANFMRYERPGKGRLREFYQLNADLIGPATPMADAEILGLLVDILTAYGAGPNDFLLRVSDRRLFDSFLGETEKETKRKIGRLLDKREKIDVATFEKELAEVCADKGLENKIQKFLTLTVKDLPELAEKKEIDAEVAAHISEVYALLGAQGKVEYVSFDPGVLRGFDYYTGLIFEVQDRDPENRRAICGGGRYDKLLGQFGKTELPAVGFGLGDVTLESFIRKRNLIPDSGTKAGCYMVMFEETRSTSLKLADELRKAGILVETALDSAKMGKQFETADKKKRRYVIMQGSGELEKNVIRLKDLETGDQKDLSKSDLIAALKK